MKILIVCRWHGDHAAAFITEQVKALQSLGHDVRYAYATEGGIKGNILFIRELRKIVADWKPDIIHAHYGISGFMANMQRGVPVVTTYPGTDVNNPKIRPISILSARLSAYNLFVSNRQVEKMRKWIDMSRVGVLRYGIITDLFKPMDQQKALQLFTSAKPEEVVWKKGDKLVLFSSKFNRKEKGPDLAKAVVALVNERLKSEGVKGGQVHLLPLTGGYTKEEMVWLMNAVDAAIVTSLREGSPQFTKEVMACGTPIVSVDVGDVAEQVEGLEGCYISKTHNAEDLATLLEKALAFGKTKGHEHVTELQLDNIQVAEKLVEIYEHILNA